MTYKDMAEPRFEPSNFASHVTALHLHANIFFAAKLCLITEVDVETPNGSQGPCIWQ